jgi:hypothetical protein
MHMNTVNFLCVSVPGYMTAAFQNKALLTRLNSPLGKRRTEKAAAYN